MTREMLAAKITEADIEEARKSIDESMARMYPAFVYAGEDWNRGGKIAQLVRTYRYSRMADLRYRLISPLKAFFRRHLEASR